MSLITCPRCSGACEGNPGDVCRTCRGAGWLTLCHVCGESIPDREGEPCINCQDKAAPGEVE